MPRQKPLKFQKDILWWAGFDQHGVAARVARTLDVSRVSVAGQRDNRHPVGVRTFPEHPAQVVPVYVGKAHVEQNGVREALGHLLQRITPVGGICRVNA